MKNQLLDYYGMTNAGFLHSHGEQATEKLLYYLKPQPNETILEIGCGTGATLAKIAARNKSVRLLGLERSSVMLHKAVKRLKFCGLSDSVSVQLIENPAHLPFENNSIHKIFAESVLAIQDDDVLPKIISEVSRVLKPQGLFILNETIWLPTTSEGDIKRFNSYSKTHFGIIQSSRKFNDPQDWNSLLRSSGFGIEMMKPIDEITVESGKRNFSWHEMRSAIFSLSGKIRARFHPGFRKEFKRYQRGMNGIPDGKKYMDGMLIVARKTD